MTGAQAHYDILRRAWSRVAFTKDPLREAVLAFAGDAHAISACSQGSGPRSSPEPRAASDATLCEERPRVDDFGTAFTVMFGLGLLVAVIVAITMAKLHQLNVGGTSRRFCDCSSTLDGWRSASPSHESVATRNEERARLAIAPPKIETEPIAEAPASPKIEATAETAPIRGGGRNAEVSSAVRSRAESRCVGARHTNQLGCAARGSRCSGRATTTAAATSGTSRACAITRGAARYRLAHAHRRRGVRGRCAFLLQVCGRQRVDRSDGPRGDRRAHRPRAADRRRDRATEDEGVVRCSAHGNRPRGAVCIGVGELGVCGLSPTLAFVATPRVLFLARRSVFVIARKRRWSSHSRPVF